MSGGAFNNVWIHVQDRDTLFGSVENLREMAAWLKEIGRYDAAYTISGYADEIDAAGARLEKAGLKLVELLRAAEYAASGDSYPDTIDKAFAAMTVAPPCPKCGEPMTVLVGEGDRHLYVQFLKCEDCGYEIKRTTRGPAAHG